MGNDQQNNQGDGETRPSAGKDVQQSPGGAHPASAPDNARANATPPPSLEPNPDRGPPGQGSQQGSGKQDESTQKAEIRKAVEEDNPDNKPQGQEKTGYSGGT